jgi:hypothetical protein
VSDQQARRSGVGEGNLSWHGRCDGTGVSRGGLPAGCAPEGWRAGAGGRAAHLLCAALGTLNATLYRKAFRVPARRLSAPPENPRVIVLGESSRQGASSDDKIYICFVRN